MPRPELGGTSKQARIGPAGRNRHSEARTWQSDDVVRSSSSLADGRGCQPHLFASWVGALSELKDGALLMESEGVYCMPRKVSAPGGEASEARLT